MDFKATSLMTWTTLYETRQVRFQLRQPQDLMADQMPKTAAGLPLGKL